MYLRFSGMNGRMSPCTAVRTEVRPGGQSLPAVEAELVVEPPDDPRNYRVDFSKIHRELKFDAQVGFDEGVNEIVEEFRRGRFIDWKGPAYASFKSGLKDFYQTVARSRVST